MTIRMIDPGADAARWGFDLSQQHEPDLAASVSTPAELCSAVVYAHDHGLDLAVQATGHGLTQPLRGGLLIDTRGLSRVSVDPVRRLARVSAGATWADVLAVTTPHGLAPLCGSAPAVGAIGYLLGGGLGPLGRMFGYAADRVHSIDLVTVTGSRLTASAHAEPELFWGLRGAGANFGIVTAAAIELFPVAEVYAGGLFYSSRHAAAVLDAFADLIAVAPDCLSLSVAMVPSAVRPDLPESLRGQSVVHVRVCQIGDARSAEALLRPLRKAAPSLLDTVRRLPFAQIGSLHADPVGPMPVNCRSVVLRRFDAATADMITDVVGSRPPFLIELRHLGGALARTDVPNAVGHRRGLANVFTSALPGFHSGTAGHDQNGLIRQLEPWSDGGALPNFLQGREVTTDDVRRSYDEPAWPRLTELKGLWDPTNRLRHNRNIPPNVSTGTSQ